MGDHFPRLIFQRDPTSRLDGSSHGLVELKQTLHMDGKAGAPVTRLGVQHQPRQRVVALQHVPEMYEQVNLHIHRSSDEVFFWIGFDRDMVKTNRKKPELSVF